MSLHHNSTFPIIHHHPNFGSCITLAQKKLLNPPLQPNNDLHSLLVQEVMS
jgi:hypothetical protein